MKIPLEIRKKYLTKADPEAEFFLDYFEETPSFGSYKVLEVGGNDNNLPIILAESGFMTIDSVDLMEPSWKNLRKGVNPYYVVGDFIEKKDEYWPNRSVDVIYSVSAIEHFGLGTYNKENYRPYHDVIAMRYIYDLLKPGGVAYITTPFAGKFVELRPHWRTYDYEAVMNRLVQDFNVELFETRVVEWNLPDCGKKPSAGYVAKLTRGEPYVSCLLKLRKEKKDG